MAFGFVQNLTATLAESPAASAGYLQLSGVIRGHSALSPQEQQIAMLAVSEANGCDYCMARTVSSRAWPKCRRRRLPFCGRVAI